MGRGDAATYGEDFARNEGGMAVFYPFRGRAMDEFCKRKIFQAENYERNNRNDDRQQVVD
jgi:hypothetical protein